MAARIAAMSASRRSNGAQIRKASCTGAQTSIPRSVARQAASRIISAPLACIGKLRSDLGLDVLPTCTRHPKTVCSEPVSMAVSRTASDHFQKIR